MDKATRYNKMSRSQINKFLWLRALIIKFSWLRAPITRNPDITESLHITSVQKLKLRESKHEYIIQGVHYSNSFLEYIIPNDNTTNNTLRQNTIYNINDILKYTMKYKCLHIQMLRNRVRIATCRLDTIVAQTAIDIRLQYLNK